MTQETDKNFGGFRPATRILYLKAYNFRIDRTWAANNISSGSACDECVMSIRAQSDSTPDDVCVIGTDKITNAFDLSIRCTNKPDAARSDWSEISRLNELAAGGVGDSPEQRLWSHINEQLEKIPPTASLFFTEHNGEIGLSEAWGLECRFSPTLFEKLVGDIIDQNVDSVVIGVKWVGGLIRDRYDPFKATWGLFKLREHEQPQAMEGHVCLVRWELRSEKFGDAAKSVSDEPDSTYRSNDPYSAAVGKFCRSLRDWKPEDKSPAVKRQTELLTNIAGPIAKWCEANGKGPKAAALYLEDAMPFVERLDAALHRENGPFKDETYLVWQHRNIAHIYRTTKPSQREDFVDGSELADVTSEYLDKKWLQCPYLDWMLLDASTASTIVSALEQLLVAKNGMAYELFAGVPWKMTLWKVVIRPLTFLLGWVAPAVAFYFVAQWWWPLGVGLGIFYYGLSIAMLARWLWYRLALLLTGKRSPLRKAIEVIEAADQAYASLAGPLMHVGTVRTAFNTATAAGVNWDHKVFYILDRLAEEKHLTWRNQTTYF